MSSNLQEQPESTIGHKPAEFQQPEHGRPRGEPAEEPFARSRARREEAEESDIGGEIRAREAQEDNADEGIVLGAL
jgi:hypothetical protein